MDDATINEFSAESEEIIQRVSSNLSKVEKGTAEPDVLDALYRDVHTLKGTSQLFGFLNLGRVAHAMEAALEPARRLKIKPSSEMLDSLYQCLDVLDQGNKSVQASKSDEPIGQVSEKIVSRLIEAVTHYFKSDFRVLPDQFGVSDVAPLEPIVAPVVAPVVAVPLPKAAGVSSPIVQPIAPVPSISNPSPSPKEIPLPKGNLEMSSDAPPSEPVLPTKIAPTGADTQTAQAGQESSTIRVQVSILDNLMNLVGEMVLVRNQVLQYSARNEDYQFLNLSQRLDLVTSELQGEVMKTRMQAIGNILTKFQRVVRDLAKDLGKKIELTLEGAETEIDKSLLEAIKDPLTHIIRNSCDHGVEPPADRKAAGKNEVGRVHVRSFHEGGQVIVEITDDGRGLDYQKLLKKAVEKQIITSEKAPTLSDREIGMLIFAPGFSTAATVSAVSGRGVGMDVVKTNIEKIGGVVELDSRFGKGMTIRLKIPLTLAIVPAILIASGGQPYAIPQVKLLELVRAENGEGDGPSIEYLQGKPVFRLRGTLLPLIDLREVLKLEGDNRHSNAFTNIAVLNADGKRFGLIVDEIRDTADIVVKPLGQVIKALNVYSGATIMGDGRVALILDVNGIAQKSNIFSQDSSSNTVSALVDEGRVKDSNAQEFLVFSLNSEGKFTVPLCLVNRLEEFPLDQVETAGNQRVVKYRDSVLPLISLNQFFGFATPQGSSSTDGNQEKTTVFVLTKRGRTYGIEVNQILDVLYIDSPIQDPLKESLGILGNLVLSDEIAVVVDILAIVSSITGEAKHTGEHGPAAKSKNPKVNDRAPARILVAEDTSFFRRQVIKVLESGGYQVTMTNDGREAFDTLEAQPDGFDLVLSDIEMPRMTGFELATAIRKNPVWSKLPVIALTTRFKESDREKGREVGFTRYLEKLKGEELLDCIEELLSNEGGKA